MKPFLLVRTKFSNSQSIFRLLSNPEEWMTAKRRCSTSTQNTTQQIAAAWVEPGDVLINGNPNPFPIKVLDVSPHTSIPIFQPK